MAKIPTTLFRSGGLLAVAVIALVILVPPIQDKRSERRIRAMLLEVQNALQKYHVEEELYPKNMMTGAKLAALLADGGFLEKGVLNPWSGVDYVDSEDADWLRYRTDGLAETYELIVFYPGTETEQFRLDSTENQSLEE